MPKLIGDDGKPLSADRFRKLLREEATHLLREPRAKLPAYGQPCSKARGHRSSVRGRSEPVFAAGESESCIYVIGAPGHPVKVGFARNVANRIRAIQTGFPHPLRLYLAVRVDEREARLLERRCHDALRPKRLNGEWFDVPAAEAMRIVREIAAPAA